MKMNYSAILIGALMFSGTVSAQTEQQEMSQMSPEQMAMMQAWEASAKPGAEHERLAGMVGKWAGKVESWAIEGAEPAVSESSVERVMTLDGRVLEERWSGHMMGMLFTGHGRTGFDNVSNRYWTTWTDNMSTGLMVMEGEFDEAGQQYVFTSSYIDPVTKDSIDVRSVTRTMADGREMMEMYETREGSERMTMRITLTRQ